MQVAARMTSAPVAVSPRDVLAKAQTLMQAGGFRRVPVIEQGKLVGILSERDLRQHLGYLQSTRVDGAMTPSPLTVSSHMSVQDAARLLLEHKVGGVPVVDDGELVGIVTTSDLLKALLDVIEATEELLDG